MFKLGFFGGSFNPPNNMHLKIALNMLEKHKLDKVYFVPVGDFYNKADLLSAKHRYNMLMEMTKNHKKLFVDDVELHINKKLYAIDIMEIILSKYNRK